MMLNKQANYKHRSERVKERIGRSIKKVIGDSLVPPSMAEAESVMADYWVTVLNDTSLVPAEQRRKESRRTVNY